MYHTFTKLMNVPYQALIVGSNEVFKKILSRRKVDLNFWTYFSCASVAGFLASVATMPLDNIRTRMNTQCDLVARMGCPDKLDCLCTKDMQGRLKYRSSWNTVKEIVAQEGLRGFFKGLVPRAATQSLSSAVSWSTYEFIKSLMGVKAHH